MKRVLIADDSPSCVLVAQRFLEEAGYRVEVVTDGQAAVERVQNGGIDLVIMDVVMPVMNGFQATRAIAKNPDTAHVPVVIVSSKEEDTDRVWGLRQGARSYLAKPIEKKSFLERIAEFLPERVA